MSSVPKNLQDTKRSGTQEDSETDNIRKIVEKTQGNKRPGQTRKDLASTSTGTDADDSNEIPIKMSRLCSSAVSIDTQSGLDKSATEVKDSGETPSKQLRLRSYAASIDAQPDLDKSATDVEDSGETPSKMSRLGSFAASIDPQSDLDKSATDEEDSGETPSKQLRLRRYAASINTQPDLDKSAPEVEDSGETPKVSRLVSSTASIDPQPDLKRRKRYVYAFGGIKKLLELRVLVERYDIDNDHPREVIEQSTSKVQAIKATSKDEIANPGKDDRHRIEKCSASADERKTWMNYDFFTTGITPLDIPIRGMGVTLHKGLIWVAGGLSRTGRNSRYVFTYILNNRRWKRQAMMSQARARFGLISYKGKLYAIGGSCCGKALKTTEVYNADKSKWELSSALEQARFGFGTTLWRDHIYVAGGRSGGKLSSIERFDGKIWKPSGLLKIHRKSFGICVVNDILYAVGGDTECTISYLKDDVGSTWNHCYNINVTEVPGKNISVAAIDGKIYIFGGTDQASKASSKVISRFDPVTKRLERMESMLSPRISPGIIVMPQ